MKADFILYANISMADYTFIWEGEANQASTNCDNINGNKYVSISMCLGTVVWQQNVVDIIVVHMVKKYQDVA